MKRKISEISCWVVGEGLVGTENQCIAVAEAMGAAHEVKRIQLREPWKSLSPYLGFECALSFSPALCGPWPDLVIAAGRKSIAAARYIKRKSGGKTFTVHIQDPRISPKHFDLVAAPAHDPLASDDRRAENVIITQASPNRLSQDTLLAAKNRFSQFEAFNGPRRVAVLIGGNSKTHVMDADYMKTLAEQLSKIEGSLMITTSRRTGENNEAILRNALKGRNAYIWDGRGENPYFGMIAWADFILVTADSASMLSDACSTGKPTYMIDMPKRKAGKQSRIDKLHTNLQNIGAMQIFDGSFESRDYVALNDAQMVAQAIKEKMSLI